MALSKEIKDALSDHYKNTDLYDPSKAPEQEVMTFKPKGLSMGGEAGYADGGDVQATDLGPGPLDQLLENPPAPAPLGEFDGPAMSADTDTFKSRGNLPGGPPDVLKDALANVPASRPNLTAAPISIPPAAPAKAPAAAIAAPAPTPVGAGKMEPDEYAQLIAALKAKPSLGSRAASAFAGLADGIMSGVARAGNPGFQKNIADKQQNQRQALIDTLRGKYESGFKSKELEQGGQKITEEGRHNKAAEQIGSEEAAARLAEAKSGLQQNALEAMGRLSESGGITGRVLGQPAPAQEAINALAERAGLRAPAAKIPTITTKAQYDALPKGTHYQDGAGKQGVKK